MRLAAWQARCESGNGTAEAKDLPIFAASYRGGLQLRIVCPLNSQDKHAQASRLQRRFE